jgi:hypothetical protein
LSFIKTKKDQGKSDENDTMDKRDAGIIHGISTAHSRQYFLDPISTLSKMDTNRFFARKQINCCLLKHKGNMLDPDEYSPPKKTKRPGLFQIDDNFVGLTDDLGDRTEDILPVTNFNVAVKITQDLDLCYTIREDKPDCTAIVVY